MIVLRGLAVAGSAALFIYVGNRVHPPEPPGPKRMPAALRAGPLAPLLPGDRFLGADRIRVNGAPSESAHYRTDADSRALDRAFDRRADRDALLSRMRFVLTRSGSASTMPLQEVVRQNVAQSPLLAGYLDRERECVALVALPDPAGGTDYWLSRGGWEIGSPPGGEGPIPLPVGLDPLLRIEWEREGFDALFAEGSGSVASMTDRIAEGMRRAGWSVRRLDPTVLEGERDGRRVAVSVSGERGRVSAVAIER